MRPTESGLRMLVFVHLYNPLYLPILLLWLGDALKGPNRVKCLRVFMKRLRFFCLGVEISDTMQYELRYDNIGY